MMHGVHLAIASGIVLGACLPLLAQSVSGSAEWQNLSLTAKTHEALMDARSISIEHERRVTPSKGMIVGDTQLVFERNGSRAKILQQRDGMAVKEIPLTRSTQIVQLELLGRKDYGLSVRWDQEAGVFAVASAFGLKIKAAGVEGHVVDSDLDGNIGSPLDGCMVLGSKSVGPWVGELWSSSGGIAVRTVDGVVGVRAIPVPKPSDADHAAAFHHLNWVRQQVGIPPVGYDPSLEPAMVEHAEYMHRNDAYGHGQDASLPGASPAGARAGNSCVIHVAQPSSLIAMKAQFLTLYHRHGLLDASMDRTAIVMHQGYWLCWVHARNSRARHQTGHVWYPAHGMTGVPLAFYHGGEWPMPVVDRPYTPNGLGTAVALDGVPSGRTRYGVEVISKVGSPEAIVHHPGNAPRTEGMFEDNFGLLSWTPLASLKPRTIYQVRMQVGEDLFAWTFTTGGS